LAAVAGQAVRSRLLSLAAEAVEVLVALVELARRPVALVAFRLRPPTEPVVRASQARLLSAPQAMQKPAAAAGLALLRPRLLRPSAALRFAAAVVVGLGARTRRLLPTLQVVLLALTALHPLRARPDRRATRRAAVLVVVAVARP
jgi:hypothetical protein